MRGREIGLAGELETTGLAPVSGDRDILDGWIGGRLSDSSRSVRSTPIPRLATVHHRVQSGNPCSPVGVSLGAITVTRGPAAVRGEVKSAYGASINNRPCIPANAV